MITAIIVEDEAKGRKLLKEMITDHCYGINIIAEADDVDSARIVIEKNKPQIVFLDIELHNRTSFELLAELEGINFEIIFTTAYDHYALKAFKFCAIDYLLKPVDLKELRAAINRAESRIEKQNFTKHFDVMMENLKNHNYSQHQIALPNQEGLVFVKIADIVFCQSDGPYTSFFMKDKKTFVTSKNLKDYEDLLSEYNFFRIHNSHLINIAHLQKYVRGDGGHVIMSDGTLLNVSKRKKELFISSLNRAKN